MSDTFVIIDGNALIHRAFHALPQFRTSGNELVNAVYGFASVLLSIFEREQPKYIAVAFDLKGPTFRHELYKQYKATRVKAPDELYAQIPRVHELVKAFGIPIFAREGFEADDLIGTLTNLASKEAGIKSVVVTGDMDAAQLVSENTVLALTKNGFSNVEYYDRDMVYKRYGVTPEQLVDYKALVGDSSDNIKGVSGIGPKTAVYLLQNYKNLEGIYEHVKELSSGVRSKLEQNKEEAFLSQKLARVVTDVPVEFDLKECRAQVFDMAKVKNVFKELEFKRLLGKLEHVFKEKIEAENVQMSMF